MKKTTFGKLWRKALKRGVNIYFTSDAQPWEALENEFKKSQIVYFEDEGDCFQIISPYIELDNIVINGDDYLIKKFVEIVE